MSFDLRFEVKDTCLEHIFECGQCFRWDRNEDGSYSGIAASRPANIRLEQAPGAAPFSGGTLIVTGADFLNPSIFFRRMVKTESEMDPKRKGISGTTISISDVTTER